jgi:hypothetical protein
MKGIPTTAALPSGAGRAAAEVGEKPARNPVECECCECQPWCRPMNFGGFPAIDADLLDTSE